MENTLNIKYQIGREPEGEHVLEIPDVYENVSRQHAVFYKENQDFVLEDISSNGTYVNGVRIKKSVINESDFAQLGSLQNGYVLIVKDLIRLYNQEVEKNRTDFSSEFYELKEVYESFDKKRNKLIKNAKLSGVLPRILISIAMIGAIYFFPIPPDLKYPLIMGVGIIGMAVSVMSKAEEKMKKKLEELIIEYNRKYVCPKCKNKLNIQSKSYNMLYEDGKCPYKNCDATYK